MKSNPLFESTMKTVIHIADSIEKLQNGEEDFEDWEFEFEWMHLIRTIFEYCMDSNYDIQGFIEKYISVDKDFEEITEEMIEIEFKMLYSYLITRQNEDVFELVKHVLKFSNDTIITEEDFREELELEIQTLKEQDISIESVL